MNSLSEQPVLKRGELILSAEYAEPQGDAARLLADVWQRVLNIDCVGLYDDFFELGGDSLGASVIAGEIEGRFKCNFSPSQMINAPTIGSQIAIIEKQMQSATETPSNLIICRAEGRKAPLFIVHGAVGFTIYDRRFLDGMDKDRPVVFIEAPGLDGRHEPLNTIEEMATNYLQSMRQIAPGGNWLLAANCAGGLIAAEMCRQAEKTGEKIDRLMLIDPMPKIFKKAYKVRIWRWKRKIRAILPKRVRSFLNRVRGRSAQTSNEEGAYERSLDFRRRRQVSLENRIRMKVGEGPSKLVAGDAAYSADAMRRVSRSLGRAFRGYAPTVWNGPAFVLSSEPRKDGLGILKHFLPRARFRVVPYHHGSLFVQGLPEILRFFADTLTPDAESSFRP